MMIFLVIIVIPWKESDELFLVNGGSISSVLGLQMWYFFSSNYFVKYDRKKRLVNWHQYDIIFVEINFKNMLPAPCI